MVEWLLVFCAVLSAYPLAISLGNVNSTELNALYDLYNSTRGSAWRWTVNGTIWNFTVPDPNPCYPLWQGVTCNCSSTECYVSELALPLHRMIGTIPASIGNLSQLHLLNLSYNHLHSTIPKTVGTLVKLTHLDLDTNRLTGSIPLLSSLTNLIFLRLSGNVLHCTIPPDLLNLTTLQLLSLGRNGIHGSIPSAIGQLINVRELNLGFNDFTGQVPAEIGNLNSLQLLQFANNYINGTIPSEMCRLSLLQAIDWNLNFLVGTIPECLGELGMLSFVRLSSNQLTGSIPHSLGRLTNLVWLFLFENQLTGSLPASVFNSSQSLRFVDLDDNLFTGTVPPILLPKLYYVNLGLNLLSGSIPDSFCNSADLSVVYLYENQLVGSIPDCVGLIPLLYVFGLWDNQLTGSLPQLFQILSETGNFEVDSNQLTGSIPESLCQWNLWFWGLNENYFQGTIPDCSTTGRNQAVEYFYLSNNLLSGSLPQFLINQTQLVYMEVNDNMISGTLPSFVNSTRLAYVYAYKNKMHGTLNLNPNSSSIQYVDISNNLFSGTIPTAFFNRFIPLQSFAAASNCFTGSIPSEICNVKSLLFLDLDGLTTAAECRTAIFPHSKTFTSYTLSNSIAGGIPVCLFNMPSLQTLHLSGNSIDWSFPRDEFVVNDALTELSLSHNKLKGTIPNVIQNKQWISLDLSYNRLVGTLSLVEQSNVNSSLIMQVNRLSGEVPSSVLQLNDINILTGNLFGCNTQRDQLPIHDHAYQIYQCGSNLFNQASIMWLCCATVVAIILVIALLSRKYWMSQFESHFQQYWDLLQQYMSEFDDQPGNSRLHRFKLFVLSIRNTVGYLTVGILLIFLPVYATLTSYYKTAEYQYAWTVSAAFLSGVTPAIVLLLFYLGFILVLFLVWLLYTNQLSVTPVRLLRALTVDTVGIASVGNGDTTVGQNASLTLLVILNCIVMILVNGAYVIVNLGYGTDIIFCAQVAIALFKLLWNDFAVRGMIVLARRTYDVQCGTCISGGRNGDDSSGTVKRKQSVVEQQNDDVIYVAQEMPYMTFIVLFNSIIAPCLATAAVDTNCFYNVFIAPSAVTSPFPITSSDIVCGKDGLESCNRTTVVSYLDVSYDPPFIYSYQCTSSILTNYASVYVFMFLMVAFIKPAVLYLMLKYHSWLKTGTFIHTCIDTTIYNLLKPAEVSKLEDCEKKGLRFETLFQRERFVLRTVGKIAVFVTFGVIFPPLAAVLCVAFVSETYLNLLIIGRYLSQIKGASVKAKFRELLNRDCEDCTDLLLVPLVRLVVPFAALFYGFFVFDIYGDKVGFKRSIWAPVLLVMFPVVLWVGYSILKIVSRFKEGGKARSVSTVGTEMLTVKNALSENEIEKA